MSPATRTRAPVADPACAAAVDLARAQAAEAAGRAVGEHQGFAAEGDRVGTHFFAATEPAYAGWRWAVTVARAPRARVVTVDEVVLLPGPGALLAPEWLPWSERVRPGDLGVGDLLVTEADDERLAPAYAVGDDPEEEAVALELGLGRVRVLSLDGRDDAADRWYDGSGGPAAPIAVAAPAHCGSCGFYVGLLGGLGPLFGACANEYAPDDGRVVSADHGCGAHSEAAVVPATPDRVPALVDDYRYEDVSSPAEPAEPMPPATGTGTPATGIETPDTGTPTSAGGPAAPVPSSAEPVRTPGPAANDVAEDADSAEQLGHS